MVNRDKFLRSSTTKFRHPRRTTSRGRTNHPIHEDTHGDGVSTSTRPRRRPEHRDVSVHVAAGGYTCSIRRTCSSYPDRNNDDGPTATPRCCWRASAWRTRLGRQSLRWAPTAGSTLARGSTVTGHVKRPGDKKRCIRWDSSSGATIRRVAVTRSSPRAGNAFGLEFDAKGRSTPATMAATRAASTTSRRLLPEGLQQARLAVQPLRLRLTSAMSTISVPRFTHTS